MPRYALSVLPPLLVLLAVALLVLAAGCAEQVPASVSKVESHWNFGLGCYWKPSGTVFNSGDAVARNVIVYVQLVDLTSGNIRDSKTIAVGDLVKGDSRTFEVSLDGECDRNYRVEVRPTQGT